MFLLWSDIDDPATAINYFQLALADRLFISPVRRVIIYDECKNCKSNLKCLPR